jgi:hypothetical protein
LVDVASPGSLATASVTDTVGSGSLSVIVPSPRAIVDARADAVARDIQA